MAQTYSWLTYGTARTQLANRLGDAGNVYWRDTELGAYIKEALRTWSSFSAFWRERGTFVTAANTPFYDLATSFTPAGFTDYNVKDQELVKSIQYHLIENANTDPLGSTWVGTDMFTLDDVTRALERRRNQFLAETGLVVANITQAMPPPPIGRLALPDTTIDVRRAIWKRVDGVYFNLWRSTEWELNSGALNWSVNPTTPFAFGILATPPLTIQVGPAPIDIGTLDLVVVQTPANLAPATGVLMNIPDDYTWIVKWGALADLLGKDGQARDPERAAWCEKRYELGVKLARMAALVIQAEINGVPLIEDALEAIDAGVPGWQGNATAKPTAIGVAGRNLIAVQPVPDGIYSITMDVVRNAPLPTLDSDLLQIGREEFDAILDYAEHLAAFKMGGAEFDATLRQADNFMKQAVTYNERLAASSLFVVPSAEQSRAEEAWRIRRRPGEAINA